MAQFNGVPVHQAKPVSRLNETAPDNRPVFNIFDDQDMDRPQQNHQRKRR
jgi:hypothetical protein